MPAETKIYSLLTGATLITAITSTRIFPMVVPQGVAAFPALTYSRVSGHRIYDLSGYSGLENPHIEIACIATDYAGAKDLSTRVDTTMRGATGFKSILVDDRDDNDPDIWPGMFRITLEFSIWNQDT